jgi:hypothetical protein
MFFLTIFSSPFSSSREIVKDPLMMLIV